jgi:hypothetical protein
MDWEVRSTLNSRHRQAAQRCLLRADCVEKLKNEAARDFRETQIEIVLRELVALQ